MFTLTFDTDNAAFAEEGEISLRVETASILRRIADHVEGDWDGWTKFQAVRDINGNRIGQWKLNPEEQR